MSKHILQRLIERADRKHKPYSYTNRWSGKSSLAISIEYYTPAAILAFVASLIKTAGSDEQALSVLADVLGQSEIDELWYKGHRNKSGSILFWPDIQFVKE